MLKRALFAFTSLLIILSTLFVVASPVKAQTEDAVDELLKEFKLRRSGDQMNLETWYSGKATDDSNDPSSIGFSDIVLLDAYSRMVGDKDNDDNLQILRNLIVSDKDGNLVATLPEKIAPGSGIVGQVGKFIGLAYTSPPVSLSGYLANVKQNMQNRGVVKPVYAQGAGFGFNNLLPVIDIWRAFRNVAYFVFILVFVLYGFMIMFRMKINPQNVATFQTAIPKIVTTLLLITFSYAIAGFMIDLMFLIFNFILSVFQTSGMITSVNNIAVKTGSGQLGLLPSWFLSTLLSFLFVPSSLINVLTGLPGWVSVITDVFLSAIGLGLIFRIIILIAIGYSYFKLIFKLFESYITVIIQVIFSPIILLQDVLPGSQAFGNWARNIFANLSVFPVTMVMFLLSYIFMVQPLIKFWSNFPVLGGLAQTVTGVKNLSDSATGFDMPLINVGGDVAAEAILAVVGFFIILMASKYVDMVKDALKVPPFKYGSAIGEALQFGYGAQRGQVGTEIAARMPGAYGRAYRTSRAAVETVAGAGSAFEAPKAAQRVQVITPPPGTTPPTTP